MVGPAAGFQPQAAAAGDVGVLPLDPPEPWPTTSRGTASPATSHRQGSTLDNGAANYFVLHNDVADLTESTAVTFLGMSVTCCQAPQPPAGEMDAGPVLGAWPTCSRRVGLKNGDRAGEVLVQSRPDGDVLHPRRGVPCRRPRSMASRCRSTDPTDRRAYFADWLTRPDNPYFAKALVNRVWRNFMGRGLVEAEDDLRETNPPTNRELFDALAKDFVDAHYDVKHLIRTIMNSAAYQRRRAAAGQRSGRSLLFALPRPPAAGRSDPRRLLASDRRADAVQQGLDRPRARRRSTAYDTYPKALRAAAIAGLALVSRFLDAFGRPDRVQTCSCERPQDASGRPGAAPEQRPDAQRQAAGEGIAWCHDGWMRSCRTTRSSTICFCERCRGRPR